MMMTKKKIEEKNSRFFFGWEEEGERESFDCSTKAKEGTEPMNKG